MAVVPHQTRLSSSGLPRRGEAPWTGKKAPSNDDSSNDDGESIRSEETGQEATTGDLPPNDQTGVKEGHWSAEEHQMFLRCWGMHGKSWKKIADVMKTRSNEQIRTHAPKYFGKLRELRSHGFDGSYDMNEYRNLTKTFVAKKKPALSTVGIPTFNQGRKKRSSSSTKRTPTDISNHITSSSDSQGLHQSKRSSSSREPASPTSQQQVQSHHQGEDLFTYQRDEAQARGGPQSYYPPLGYHQQPPTSSSFNPFMVPRIMTTPHDAGNAAPYQQQGHPPLPPPPPTLPHQHHPLPIHAPPTITSNASHTAPQYQHQHHYYQQQQGPSQEEEEGEEGGGESLLPPWMLAPPLLDDQEEKAVGPIDHTPPASTMTMPSSPPPRNCPTPPFVNLSPPTSTPSPTAANLFTTTNFLQCPGWDDVIHSDATTTTSPSPNPPTTTTTDHDDHDNGEELPAWDIFTGSPITMGK